MMVEMMAGVSVCRGKEGKAAHTSAEKFLAQSFHMPSGLKALPQVTTAPCLPEPQWRQWWW